MCISFFIDRFGRTRRGQSLGLYEVFVSNVDQTLGISFFFPVVRILLFIDLSCIPGDLLWVKAGGRNPHPHHQHHGGLTLVSGRGVGVDRACCSISYLECIV
jgi:hypothetical protein